MDVMRHREIPTMQSHIDYCTHRRHDATQLQFDATQFSRTRSVFGQRIGPNLQVTSSLTKGALANLLMSSARVGGRAGNNGSMKAALSSNRQAHEPDAGRCPERPLGPQGRPTRQVQTRCAHMMRARLGGIIRQVRLIQPDCRSAHDSGLVHEMPTVPFG